MNTPQFYTAALWITYVVLVCLKCSFQCDRQLLVNLMDSRLDFHLEAPLCCFYTILSKTNAQPHKDRVQNNKSVSPLHIHGRWKYWCTSSCQTNTEILYWGYSASQWTGKLLLYCRQPTLSLCASVQNLIPEIFYIKKIRTEGNLTTTTHPSICVLYEWTSQWIHFYPMTALLKWVGYPKLFCW